MASRRWVACLVLVAGPAAASSAFAQSPAGEPQRPARTPSTSVALAGPAPPDAAPSHHLYTLRECLALVDQNHPNILAARDRVDNASSQLDEAHFAPYTQFSMTAGVAPAPTFRGGAIYTQDNEVGLNSNFGLAWQASVSGTVPLWTFGKITNTWRAAEGQLEVSRYDVRRARNQAHLDVRRAYYGLQVARDAMALLGDASSKLEKAVGDVDKKVKTGDADPIDAIRLKVARAEVAGRLADAERGEQVALGGLRFLTGVGAAFDIPQTPLRAPKHEVAAVGTYLEEMRVSRPEVNQARVGVDAYKALADLARSKFMPDLGITLFASYTRAPEITTQLNPFTRYDANVALYGFAFGLRWMLDFPAGVARIHEADAQLAEKRETYRLALGGLGVEVQAAYADVVAAKKKVDAFQEASKLARQWLLQVTQGIDIGTFDEKDLVDPARTYALQRTNYLTALLDLNMAMANLALATGRDDLAETDD